MIPDGRSGFFNISFFFFQNSEVWGGYFFVNCDRLERKTIMAARIVTGLVIFTSRESLYFETGLGTLSCRWQISWLKAMYISLIKTF